MPTNHSTRAARWKGGATGGWTGGGGQERGRRKEKAVGAPVTWFEISTSDPRAAREVYSDVFGWKMDVLEESNYAVVDTGVKGAIGGGIGQAEGLARVGARPVLGDRVVGLQDPGARQSRARRPPARPSRTTPGRGRDEGGTWTTRTTASCRWSRTSSSSRPGRPPGRTRS